MCGGRTPDFDTAIRGGYTAGVNTKSRDRNWRIEFESKLPQLREIFAAADCVVAYLHGSYAEGCASALSDIDFAVLLPDEVPEREYMRREMALTGRVSALLHTDDVDVKVVNRTPLLFQAEVIRTGQRVYVADEEARVWWEWRTMSEWMDFHPLLDYQDKCFLERIREGRFGR